MKNKAILAVFVVIISSILFASQAHLVNAQTGYSQAPITKPISYFVVSGKVAYKLFSGFIPASGVTMSAENLDTHNTALTLTDIYGQYTFLLPEGKYLFKAADLYQTRFTPAERILNVVRDITGVKFVGVKSR